MPDLRSMLEQAAERGDPRGAHTVYEDARADAASHRVEVAASSPRRRVWVAVGVAAACVGLFVYVRARVESEQHVATVRPPSTQDAIHAGSLTDNLEWSSDGQLILADPRSGEQRSIAQVASSCPRNCPLTRLGTDTFLAAGRVIRVDADGTVTDVGPGQAVIPTPSRTAMYVVDSVQSTSPTDTTTVVHALLAPGTPAGGPWTVPNGYVLSAAPRATTRGLLVQSNENAVDQTLAIWDPQTGALDVIGPSRAVIDVFTSPDSDDSTVAYTKAGCESVGCGITVLDLGTRRTLDVASPTGANGFYGGGAFSPDGKFLAAFAATSSGTTNPSVTLAMIEVATGTTTAISGSEVAVGEPIGYATWSPSSKWVFFGGAAGNIKAHYLAADDAITLPFSTTYGFIAVGPPGDNTQQAPTSTTVATKQNSGSTACPGSVPRRTVDDGDVNADALPYVDNAVTNVAVAQTALTNRQSELAQRYPDAVSIEVGPGFGRAWGGQNGGQYDIVNVDDYALIVHLRSQAACPLPPGLYTSIDNVPLFFVVDG